MYILNVPWGVCSTLLYTALDYLLASESSFPRKAWFSFISWCALPDKTWRIEGNVCLQTFTTSTKMKNESLPAEYWESCYKKGNKSRTRLSKLLAFSISCLTDWVRDIHSIAVWNKTWEVLFLTILADSQKHKSNSFPLLLLYPPEKWFSEDFCLWTWGSHCPLTELCSIQLSPLLFDQYIISCIKEFVHRWLFSA